MGAIVLTGIPVGSNVANALHASAGLVHQPMQQYPYVVQVGRAWWEWKKKNPLVHV